MEGGNGTFKFLVESDSDEEQPTQKKSEIKGNFRRTISDLPGAQSIRKASSMLPTNSKGSTLRESVRRAKTMPVKLKSTKEVQQVSTPEALAILKRYVNHAAFMASGDKSPGTKLAQKLFLAVLGLFHEENFVDSCIGSSSEGSSSDKWLRDLLRAADSSGSCLNKINLLKLKLSHLFEHGDTYYPQLTVLKAIEAVGTTIYETKISNSRRNLYSDNTVNVEHDDQEISAWEMAFVQTTRRDGQSRQSPLTEADGLNDSNLFALLNIGEKMSVIIACSITNDWTATIENTTGIAIFRSFHPVAGSIAALIVIISGLVQMALRIPSRVLLYALTHPKSIRDPNLQVRELYRLGFCTVFSFLAGFFEVLNGLDVLVRLGIDTPFAFGLATAWIYAVIMVAVELSNATHSMTLYFQAKQRVKMISEFHVKDSAIPLLARAKGGFLSWAKKEEEYTLNSTLIARDFAISMIGVLFGLVFAAAFVDQVDENGEYEIVPTVVIWLCFAIYWLFGMAAHVRGYLQQRKRRKAEAEEKQSYKVDYSSSSSRSASTTSDNGCNQNVAEQEIIIIDDLEMNNKQQLALQ